MIRCDSDGFISIFGHITVPLPVPIGYKRPRWTGRAWEEIPLDYDYASRKRKENIILVDTTTDEIYRVVVGFRAAEYEKAEKEAIEFKASGFVEPAPSSVTSWAAAKGWSNQQAAEDILAAATAWRTAQAAIRQMRLATKEQLRQTESLSEIATIMQAWNTFVQQLRAQLT